MSMDLKMNGLWRYVQDDEILDAEPLVKVAQDTLEQRKGAGNDFLGWLDLPENYDREEFTRIKQAAEVKLENGVISVTDLIREINAEDMARQTAAAHRVQRLMTIYNYMYTTN